MNQEFKNIIKKFKEINNKKYIKGVNNNLVNSCGLTFENLINKKTDSLFFPDYQGVEIKCTQRYSHYPISLFSLSFDGPDLFESNYLLQKYGYNDQEYPELKKLVISLKYKRKVYVGNNYFELDIDSNKILINIYDKKYHLIEKRGFIDFENIKSRLEIKLKQLCLVYASKKIIDDNLYFRYYKIECFLLKNFEIFKDLIKKDIIVLTLMLRFSRNENTLGKNKNKGINFTIKKDAINELFEKIYEYEN